MKQKSILFIDDEPNLRMIFSEILAGFGFSAFVASDGREGLDSFREHQPDLVMCDLRMPRMDGLEVLKTIRQESPNTPVIMLSGEGRMPDVVEALHLGAWDYLMKPIRDFDVLRYRLSQCFERAQLVEENLAHKKNLEETNARLKASLEELEVDEKAGRHIQEKLLPKSGQSFGPCRFEHALIPSSNLSGDFVDYFALPENRVGFYIADVSGHGASSAFVTVFLKMLVGQLIRENHSGTTSLIQQPGALCAYLNQKLYSAGFRKYLTLIYGVLDLEQLQMDYTVAGHYPPPIFCGKDSCRLLEERSAPIGLFENQTYHQDRISLEAGGRLYLFSDGVLEVMSAPDLKQKEDRLVQLCEQPSSVSELLDTLGVGGLDSILDDITLLKLEVEKI